MPEIESVVAQADDHVVVEKEGTAADVAIHLDTTDGLRDSPTFRERQAGKTASHASARHWTRRSSDRVRAHGAGTSSFSRCCSSRSGCSRSGTAAEPAAEPALGTEGRLMWLLRRGLFRPFGPAGLAFTAYRIWRRLPPSGRLSSGGGRGRSSRGPAGDSPLTSRRCVEAPDQLGQRHVCERLEHEVGVIQCQRRGDRIRHGDAEQACGLRGRDAVRRILERDRLARLELEPDERVQVEIGPWLRAGGVAVRRDDRVEPLEVAEPAEVALDPVVVAAADDRGASARGVRRRRSSPRPRGAAPRGR